MNPSPDFVAQPPKVDMSSWSENAQFRQHALDCGLDMTGAAAMGLDEEASGYALAHRVLDPVHMDVLCRAGTVLTERLIQWLRTFGLDYVTVCV